MNTCAYKTWILKYFSYIWGQSLVNEHILKIFNLKKSVFIRWLPTFPGLDWVGGLETGLVFGDQWSSSTPSQTQKPEAQPAPSPPLPGSPTLGSLHRPALIHLFVCTSCADMTHRGWSAGSDLHGANTRKVSEPGFELGSINPADPIPQLLPRLYTLLGTALTPCSPATS